MYPQYLRSVRYLIAALHSPDQRRPRDLDCCIARKPTFVVEEVGVLDVPAALGAPGQWMMGERTGGAMVQVLID